MTLNFQMIIILSLATIFLIGGFINYFTRRSGESTFIFFAASAACFYIFFMTTLPR